MAIYFPVLRWKMGERHALRHLSPAIKSQIAPILEFPPNCEMGDKKIRSFCADAVKEWGTGRPFYLDISYIDSLGFSSLDILRDAYQQQLVCIPTYNTEFGGNALNVVLKALTGGYCFNIAFRVTENVSSGQIESFNQALRASSIRKGQVDLIVDMRDLSSGSIRAKVRLLESLIRDLGNSYRQSILVGGAFTQEQIRTDSHGFVSRYDWELWKYARLMPGLGNLLYGDYATVVCEFRESRYLGAPKVKYTTEDGWFCIKGHKARGRDDQRIRQAAAIAAESFYRGDQYSHGDQQIHLIATGRQSQGNATTWVTNDINQHITFVVSQVSAIPPVP